MCHFGNETETEAEMIPAIVSGIVNGDAHVNYWPIFPLSLVTAPEVFAGNNLVPVSHSFLKWRI